MRFIVTGCGRSGTSYIADRLIASGVSCGHEKVFTVSGPRKNLECLEGDSSWFAAPFLGAQYQNIRVLHIVRDPRHVVESFHRIGLCADSRYRHFALGGSFLVTAFRFNLNIQKMKVRWKYVSDHRALLHKYTTCLERNSEFERLCEYWFQWNTLVERRVHKCHMSYLRLRLEDVDNCWGEIKDFLDLDFDVEAGEPTNKKNNYGAVRQFDRPLPKNVIYLANRYGYNY